MVDWDLAVATGMRLVRPGPRVSADEAAAAVGDLRRYAEQAQGHVASYTGLSAPSNGSSVAVIDRPAWIRANASGFQTVLEPLIEKLQERKGASSPAVSAVGSRVTGVQTGSLLAFLATKVLGQYELFPPYGKDASTTPGRLLLVAPNIVAAELEMRVDPSDFRLWVCVHEETHRVQFGAVPWLRGHLMEELEAFIGETEVDASAVVQRLRAAVAATYEAVRSGGAEGSGGSLLEAVQTPAQREILDRITALMSLLEGHADYVMDGVGPAVIPSVKEIREKFQARRRDAKRAELVVRRLLGIDAKLRQYRDGERFVRAAVNAVGMSGFNAVWDRPENLPSKAELTDAAAWARRVHGSAA
jgi:coenzyme F420 biosynthesis associated uncharacterized protein